MLCKADGQKCGRDFSGFSNADHHLKFLFFIHQEPRKYQHDTIDAKIQFLTGTLKIASDKFAPLKSIEATDKKSTWITNNIKTLMKNCDKAHAIFLKIPSLMNELKYKKLRNSVTGDIRRAKRSYHDNKVKISKSSKDIFGCFNHLCGKKRKKNTEVDVEKFNEFFVKIGKQLASKCSPVNSNINSDNDGPDQTFVLFNTDAKEDFNIRSI